MIKIIIMFISVHLSFSQNSLVFSGDYFGQKPPGNNAVKFLPEVFNQFKYVHGKLVFSPDKKELIWVITTKDNGIEIEKRLFIKQNNEGIWENPVDSFLSIESKENGPSFSFDGKKLFYQSRNSGTKDIDIYFREKLGNSWSNPINIGNPVNTKDDESQPWITRDGSIIFCRNNKVEENNKGGSDIYISHFKNGKFIEPECFGKEINSKYHETEPVMSPDGSYLLFISNRPGGYSRMMNLYVSFKTPDGKWTDAECLSHFLKIDNIWFPTISYDGKYLFFCGGYPAKNGGYSESHYYWVNTDFINKWKYIK